MNKCSIDGCANAIKYRGLCGKHYKRQWRHGDANFTAIAERGANAKTLCLTAGCEERPIARGLCNGCRIRLKRNGSTDRKRAKNGESDYVNAGGYRVVNGFYAHRIITDAPLGSVVHHINGDRLDNRLENLTILPNQSEHMKLHRRKNE